LVARVRLGIAVQKVTSITLWTTPIAHRRKMRAAAAALESAAGTLETAPMGAACARAVTRMTATRNSVIANTVLAIMDVQTTLPYRVHSR